MRTKEPVKILGSMGGGGLGKSVFLLQIKYIEKFKLLWQLKFFSGGGEEGGKIILLCGERNHGGGGSFQNNF